MKTKLAILVCVLLMVSAAGCGNPKPPTERQTWAIANISYTTTINVIADLIDADKIDLDTAEEIDKWRMLASVALDSWKEALLVGLPPEKAIVKFEAAMTEIENLKNERIKS